MPLRWGYRSLIAAATVFLPYVAYGMPQAVNIKAIDPVSSGQIGVNPIDL